MLIFQKAYCDIYKLRLANKALIPACTDIQSQLYWIGFELRLGLRDIEKNWEKLRNIEKYWEILRNIKKCWEMLRNIEKY